MRNRILLLAGLLVCLVAFPAGKLVAQAVYGTIVGTVTDNTGAVVPNAKVTISSVGQGVSFTTTTNESGNYSQGHLIPGSYDIKVEVQGFQTATQTGLVVNADQVAQLNVQLTLGTVTQTVEVTAGAPLLKTEKADVSTSFNTRQVVDLPTFNRNYSAFELMVPGAQRLGWQHAASENPQGTIQIMVNGQHFYGTEWLLDGTDNRDVILGIQVVAPNIDAVSELKMTTADYDAEFGEASAAVMSSQTKSGTNQLHGSAFWYRHDNNETARDPFAQNVPLGGTTGRFVPDALYNQIGGSLGGPIRKDKTFIFGDYQANRRSLGGSVLTRVPTAAEREGDLRALAAVAGNIYNPFDAAGNIIPCTSASCPRQQFMSLGNPGIPDGTPNVIPFGMLSPQTQKLLSLLPPGPNFVPSSPTVPNYAASGNQVYNSDGFDIRVDQYQTDKLHILGRYSYQKYLRQGPGAYGPLAGGPAFSVDPSVGGFAGASNTHVHSLAAGFDYTLGPTWLTDFRFGFYRYAVNVSPLDLTSTPATDAGIPGLNLNAITGGMPAFFINGSGGFNFGYSLGVNQCNCPLNEQENEYQFVNNWTHIRGNHTIKFGADIRRAYNLRVPSDTHRAGELSFDPSLTEGPSVAGVNNAGLGLASFLLGDVTFFGRYVSSSTDARERQNRWFFYGEDTWRVTSKLTVNYGLRWEIFFPQSVNAPGNGGFVDIFTGETRIAGQNGIGLNGNINNTLKDFAPRLGLAYQLRPKTVLRMGYGRSYDTGVFGSTFGHTVTQNLPVLAQQQLTAPNNYEEAFSQTPNNLSVGPPGLDPSTKLQNNCQAASGGPNPITNPTGTLTSCVGPNGLLLYPDGVSPHVLPLTMHLPYVDAWNVTLQHQLSPSTSLEVAYVGNKGTNVFNGDGPNYDINTPNIVGFGTLSTNQRRKYYNLFGWTQGVQWYGNDNSDHFDGVEFTVKRVMSGLTLTANYTYAHAYQYSGGFYVWQPSVVYGPSDFFANSVLNIQHVYVLPFGRGQKWGSNISKRLDYALGGWQLNGVWTFRSGLPFTPSYSECGQDQDVGVCRPNLSGSVSEPHTRAQWFVGVPSGTLSSTSTPWSRPGTGTLGTIGYDSFRGPGFWDADLSLFKNFQVTEKLRAQFRIETFNTFNHVNIGGPDSNVDDGSTGRITGLAAGAAQRTFQFAIRLDF